jgi:hypothetical protein
VAWLELSQKRGPMHIIQRGGDGVAGQYADLAEGPILPTAW